MVDTVDLRQAPDVAGGDRRGQDIARGHTDPCAGVGDLPSLFFTGFAFHPDEHLEGGGIDRLAGIRQRTPRGGAKFLRAHLPHLIR
ncbi:hypothetical protein AB0M31_16325 [Streptomyces sp. NPDC051773]|uniref:hypothetical protein n=1 Tax=Streptomyces sp. NPDC051773 TaxID=3156682 RepID=UPI00342DBEA3